MKVVFYEVADILSCVPKFVLKLWKPGMRMAIVAPDKDMVTAIDDALWTVQQLSFLPHATCFDTLFAPEDQPIWLTTPPYVNDNNATTLININGCADPSDANLEHYVEFHTDPQKLEARKKSFPDCTHWKQQGESWQKIA